MVFRTFNYLEDLMHKGGICLVFNNNLGLFGFHLMIRTGKLIYSSPSATGIHPIGICVFHFLFKSVQRYYLFYFVLTTRL